jgi:adenylylsulfate reductase subunit B
VSWHWRLIEEGCVGCGICRDVCPSQAIDMTREMAYPVPVPDACTGCMTCVEECPVDAIEVNEEPCTLAPARPV